MCDHQLGVEVSAVFALLVLISEDSVGQVGRECLPDMSVGQWQGAVPMYVLSCQYCHMLSAQ